MQWSLREVWAWPLVQARQRSKKDRLLLTKETFLWSCTVLGAEMEKRVWDLLREDPSGDHTTNVFARWTAPHMPFGSISSKR